MSIDLVLQVFRGLHSAGLQTATFFIIEQIINKQKAFYSFITNMFGISDNCRSPHSRLVFSFYARQCVCVHFLSAICDHKQELLDTVAKHRFVQKISVLSK